MQPAGVDLGGGCVAICIDNICIYIYLYIYIYTYIYMYKELYALHVHVPFFGGDAWPDLRSPTHRPRKRPVAGPRLVAGATATWDFSLGLIGFRLLGGLGRLGL